ncbi:MAG: ABC transporter permease [Acidobacteriia bacterium]|nr:ABC transporter permease [Terriglobia bacterium]
MFARNPGFTGAAVACLALGIGATSAIFSVVNAVVLRPLPYAHSDRLVRVFTEFPNFPNGGLRHFWVSPPEYFDLKRDTHSWDALGAWAINGVNLAGAHDPVRATAAFVTGGMLSMLGAAPSLGRLITPDDDRPNVPETAVISYGLWQRAYAADPGALGRDIRLNGRPCAIVGVMPPGFHFPPGETDAPELWVPIRLDPANVRRGNHFLSVLGRLRGGVTLQQAGGEMLRYAQHSRETVARHPFDPKNHPIVLAGFQDEVVRGVRPAMLVLLGAVVFVLLIACVNVANLLLARAEARRREIAVRAAIGAGMGRLLRQFVMEGVLLSLAGAASGLALAFGGLRLLAATNAGNIPRAAEIDIDWRVLAFAVAVSLLTGLVFGLAPALHARSGSLNEVLKGAAGRAAGSVAANRSRAALVAGELALALVLLIGAGLMTKAFWKLQAVNAGIDPTGVVTMEVSLPRTAYSDAARVNAFWQALETRVSALPGVVSAAVATELPPVRPIDANDTGIEGFVPTPGGPIENVDYWNFVGPGYFETMRIPLVDGRYLNAGDGPGAPPVVVVNQAMARTYWPRESAIGRRILLTHDSPWLTIVGVVADAKNAGLDRPAGTELYAPYRQISGAQSINTAALVIRAKGDPMRMVGPVRARVRALDGALPVSKVRTMDDILDAARSRPRFLTLLLALFSALSLSLAALGVYGVISYTVAQRTSEIGIRMALGADGADVVRLIGGRGLRLALAGAVAGGVGALALTRFLSGLLFGVSAVDAGTFIAMAAALIAVTLLACYIPARRASKLDPLVALRYE